MAAATTTQTKLNKPSLAIIILIIGMIAISAQDMLIKRLSDSYPLHQIVFTRAVVALGFSAVFVAWEGGMSVLRTDTPGLHFVRGLLVAAANMTFFAALAVMPMAEATALFFVAPLLITVFAALILGERLGPRRLTAVVTGLIGVALIAAPWRSASEMSAPPIMYLLPIGAAVFYALMQVMTRKLGISAKASALAVYVQLTFVLLSALIWLAVGDGRYAAQVEDESLVFLLRAWRAPTAEDWWVLIGVGCLSGVIGYCLSFAYRAADAGAVAPFEYVQLPMAVFWGWLVWRELPGPEATLGIALVMGAGVYVFIRERQRGRSLTLRRGLRRW